MSSSIHQKIVAQLTESNVRKKDLAAALGISPQTMTDVCKGRSAVTLKHLRGLVRFFGLRPTYWLDDEREEPAPFDRFDTVPDRMLRQIEALGLFDFLSLQEVLRKVQRFVETHRSQWEALFGPLEERERQLLVPGDDEALSIHAAPPAATNGEDQKGAETHHESMQQA